MAAMESLGHRVIGLCPDPDEADTMRSLALPHYALASGRTPTPRLARVRTPKRRFTNLRPRRLAAIDFAIRNFRGVEQDAKRLAANQEANLDLIFYAGINDREFDWMHVADRLLGVPWTGLYMHASALRLPALPWANMHRRMFDVTRCRGVGVLDEGMAGKLAEVCGKPVMPFPDIAVTDGAGGSTPLSRELLKFAAGAPVVGLLGYLEMRKGVLPFLRTAAEMRGERVCFALAGELAMPEKGEIAEEFRRLIAKLPNLWHHFNPLKDGADFNGMVTACDVLYAAYLGFPYSSNLLTKAAMVQKPVVVSDGYLMAERVQKYGLGEVVKEGSVCEGVSALRRLLDTNPAARPSCRPLYAQYAAQHGATALKEAMNKLLGANR